MNTDYSNTQEIIEQQDSKKKKIEKEIIPVDTRNVILIKSESSLDFELIINTINQKINREFKPVMDGHIYALNLTATDDGEALEKEYSRIVTIISDLRAFHGTTFEERLDTNYEIDVSLEHSEKIEDKIEYMKQYIQFTQDAISSKKSLLETSKEDWLSQIIDYIYSTVDGITKNDLITYINTVFDSEQSLITNNVFKGLEMFNLSLFPVNPNDKDRYILDSEKERVFNKLQRKVSTNLRRYSKALNNENYYSNLESIAKEKGADFNNFKIKNQDKYEDADNSSDYSTQKELVIVFPVFAGVKTEPITDYSFEILYNHDSIMNGYSNGIEKIARVIANASAAWLYVHNNTLLLNHLKYCINNNSSEEIIVGFIK
jgi:tellurite resistance protein